MTMDIFNKIIEMLGVLFAGAIIFMVITAREISFKWFDIWIGVYVDTKNKCVYACPLPMIVFKFERGER